MQSLLVFGDNALEEAAMKVHAVIGAGFGDEGKGKVVCSLAYHGVDLVVRHNSGAQAAHTVMHRDGFRHVYGHIGSAASLGVPTYLSKFFVVNPVLFIQEHSKLLSSIPFKNVRVYVDIDCRITTVYDVIINQACERAKGNARHGSCGVGFHETVVRCEGQYALHVSDIVSLDNAALAKKLRSIRDNYIIPRLQSLELLDTIPFDIATVLTANRTAEIFADQCKRFLSLVNVVVSGGFLSRFKNVVFEGAQGLLLDEDHQWFPHVTHSKTGVCNVLNILENEGLLEQVKRENALSVTYVSRCYATRHGHGPFPTEANIAENFRVVDETNVHNEFQGSLRLGYLHTGLLTQSILDDVQTIPFAANVGAHFTCMDQISQCFIYANETLSEYKTYIIDDAEELLTEQVSEAVTENVSFSYSPYPEDGIWHLSRSAM